MDHESPRKSTAVLAHKQIMKKYCGIMSENQERFAISSTTRPDPDKIGVSLLWINYTSPPSTSLAMASRSKMALMALLPEVYK